MDPEVLDDPDDSSGYNNAGLPYSDNRTHSKQFMDSQLDDEEQPEYEQEYEYVQVEEDEGTSEGYAGRHHVCICICTCWTCCGMPDTC